MMVKRRAVIHQLNEYTYCIDDAGASCCYVVCGSEKAAVIDTVNGMENLKDIVREITPLPLMVINTHGHGDHTYGNSFFEEAYIHPDDAQLYDAHFLKKNNVTMEEWLQRGAAEEDYRTYMEAKPCPVKMISEGEVVKLGNVELEIIKLKGHTQGSIGLLDKASGYFFTGDAVNMGTLLHLQESSTLREYVQNLERLAPYRKDIKELHGGHSVKAIDPEMIDMMIEGARQVIENNGEGDQIESWPRGSARCHRLRNGGRLFYSREKI